MRGIHLLFRHREGQVAHLPRKPLTRPLARRRRKEQLVEVGVQGGPVALRIEAKEPRVLPRLLEQVIGRLVAGVEGREGLGA